MSEIEKLKKLIKLQEAGCVVLLDEIKDLREIINKIYFKHPEYLIEEDVDIVKVNWKDELNNIINDIISGK